jgi:uncharacterized protein YegL
VKEVQQLFRRTKTSPGTPLAKSIRELLNAYQERLNKQHAKGKTRTVKPVNFIVITDGMIHKNDPIRPFLVGAARWLDEQRLPPEQVGIQFLQIGNNADATYELTFLDDEFHETYRVRVSEVVILTMHAIN